MWQHVCLVLATVALSSSFSIQNAFPQVRFSKPLFQVTQDQRPLFRSSQEQKYDCPHEGFFINPRNCSQFYRCVDYTHTGYVYSVYAFECPRFHVFILDGENSTCVPGTECGTGTQTVPITTQRPAGTTSRTTSLRPLTVAPTFPTTARPIPPTTLRPTTSRPPFDPPLPPVVDCRGQYVQHERFCNVYYKCSNDADKFLCPAGSLFDTVRQMCRIQAADEDLCGGKSVYSQLFRYASNIPFETIGSRTHQPTPIGSYRPQSKPQPQPQSQVQSQPNYLAYFDPTHPLRMNPYQQTPLHYVQQITSPFTQGHSGGHSYRVSSNVIVPEVIISHPEPDTAFTPKFYQVVDGEKSTISQPKPENVHPRQHFVQFNEASQPLAEVVNPRQYYRPVQYQPTAKPVHPRQYYRAIDSELDASEYY